MRGCARLNVVIQSYRCDLHNNIGVLQLESKTRNSLLRQTNHARAYPREQRNALLLFVPGWKHLPRAVSVLEEEKSHRTLRPLRLDVDVTPVAGAAVTESGEPDGRRRQQPFFNQ
jgi:hypothetical protein